MRRSMFHSLVAWACVSAAAFAQDPTRALVERAIEAHGGEARLLRLPAVASRGIGTLYLQGNEHPFSTATLVQLPDGFRNETRVNIDGREIALVQGLKGRRGWSQTGGQVTALGDAEVAEIVEQMHAERAASLIPLRPGGGCQLRLAGEALVKGRPAWEVKVASKGHRDIGLFFEKSTGLLVKSETMVLDRGQKKTILQEKIVNEFRTVDGLVSPKRVSVYREGERYLELEIVEYRRVEKLDDKLFAPPD